MAGERLLARAQVLFDAVGGGEPIGERARLVGEPLLEADDFLATLARLLLGFGGELVRLFARLERGFLAKVFGVALGLAEDAIGFVAGVLDGVVRGPASGRSAPEECAARDHAHEQRGDSSETRRCHAKVPVTGPVGPGGQLVYVQVEKRRKGPALPCGEVG